MRLGRLVSIALTLAVTLAIVTLPRAFLSGGIAAGQLAAFLETFDGTPTSPQPYANPHNWSIFTQGFDARQVGQSVQVAQHGPNCEPPGFPYTASNSHPLLRQADTVFLCGSGDNTHVMTSIGLTGYGAIYMQVPAVADISGGGATIQWDMSTLRTSSRDWIDVVLTPWSEQTPLAYNNNDQHIPMHDLHIQLAGGGNVLVASQRSNGTVNYLTNTLSLDTQLPQDLFTTWDQVFAANPTQAIDPGKQSGQRRDTFAITLSRTSISVCMPKYAYNGQAQFCWLRNVPLAQPLDPAIWHDQIAVQLNHRTYNAEKACSSAEDQFAIVHNPIGDAQCPPDTWHWDNVSITPAVPYQMLKSVPESFTQNNAAPTRVSFEAPAPTSAFLSFVTFSNTPSLQISWDNGTTWITPRFQPALAPSTENGEVIFTPAPPGVTSVLVRGAIGFWGTYESGQFVLIAPPGGASVPVPTLPPAPTVAPAATTPASPTPVPTATATQTLTPTLAPTDQPTPTATALLASPTPVPALATSTPTDLPTPTQTPVPTPTATPTPSVAAPCVLSAERDGQVIWTVVVPESACTQ